MKSLRLISVIVVGACATGVEPGENQALSTSKYAHLVSAEVTYKTITETAEAQYSIAKTGVVDATADTVTWTITTSQLTPANELVLGGCVQLKNNGREAATLGNLVINLQTKVKKSWVTQASDVANATAGAAATTALVDPNSNNEHKSSFSTSSASGVIALTSPCAGSTFSLEPEGSIAPGVTTHIGFTATFNNNVLALATGTKVQAEVIVSYGNAAPNGADAANVKINGGSTQTPDEAWVGGVTRHPQFQVPAPGSATPPTIGDSTSSISTTGTASFSNAVFDIGATGGSVTVNYVGGASGGTIENCATLTGTGVSAQACDTEDIPAECTPGTKGCPWQTGDEVSFIQSDWGSGGPASATLSADYDTVYASDNDELIIGVPGDTNQYFLEFTSSAPILAYLPASGTAGPLTESLANPTTTPAGIFGGDVLALELNVDFSDAGFTGASLSIPGGIGSLVLCNLTTTPDLNGQPITALLGEANTALSGGITTDSLDDIDALVENVNAAFEQGTPSSFALANVFNNGECP
jgi:hypothetical protein